MDAPPRIPQILYGPELVADATLFAAEHPRRQIYVGGYGFMLSLLARLFPRLTDRVMEASLVATQQDAAHAGDPAARDNLFEPKKDGSVEGTQPYPVKRFSLFLEAQKHPLAGAALAGTAAGAGAWWARSRRVSGRRAAASAPARGPSAHSGDRARRARAAAR
jgi:hypothetical protein